jgi:hypothetical protein
MVYNGMGVFAIDVVVTTFLMPLCADSPRSNELAFPGQVNSNFALVLRPASFRHFGKQARILNFQAHLWKPARAMDDQSTAPRAKSTLSNLSRLFAQPSPSKRAGVRRAGPPGTTLDNARDEQGASAPADHPRHCNSMPVDWLSKHDRDALRARLRAHSERPSARRGPGSGGASGRAAGSAMPQVAAVEVPTSARGASLLKTKKPISVAPTGDQPIRLVHSSEVGLLSDGFDSDDDSDREPGDINGGGSGASSSNGKVPPLRPQNNDHSVRDVTSVLNSEADTHVHQRGQTEQVPDDVVALRRDIDNILYAQRNLAVELASLSAHQQQHYAALNELLQENFRATGALESRVDQLVGRALAPVGCASRHPITRLGWAMLDGIATILLLVISIVATPVGWMTASAQGRAAAEKTPSRPRRSWRFSGLQDDAPMNHEQLLSTARRLSFNTIQ